MSTKSFLLSHASKVFQGAAYYARYNRNWESDSTTTPVAKTGGEVTLPYFKDYAAPAALLAAGLVDAATGAELPNIATKTYTTADDNVSPIDNASRAAVVSVQMADGSTKSVWVFDVPRNQKLTVTHGSSIVAMSVLTTGYDEYGELITETLAVTATGTAKSATGKKAFKWIKSIAITSAGDATANTASLGWDNTLGLPFLISNTNQLVTLGNGALDASATVVAADLTSPPTATTGDVRGTVKFNTATDGTKRFAALMMGLDRTSKAALFGAAQA